MGKKSAGAGSCSASALRSVRDRKREENGSWSFISYWVDRWIPFFERRNNLIKETFGKMMILISCIILFWINDVAASDDQRCQIVSRDEWGAMPSNWTELFPNMPLGHVFIHHTAGPECSSSEGCASIVRGMQRYHAIDRQWGDIGYNFLIGGDGRVYEGRGWRYVGAQVYGFNRISIGIALIGGFQSKVPSDTMLMAAQTLIGCGKSSNFLSSEAKIHGHRDGGCTECPGDALENIIKTWPNFEKGPLPGYRCLSS